MSQRSPDPPRCSRLRARRASTTVKSMYYDGGRHNGIFTDSMQHDDEMRRAAAFLRRHLRD